MICNVFFFTTERSIYNLPFSASVLLDLSFVCAVCLLLFLTISLSLDRVRSQISRVCDVNKLRDTFSQGSQKFANQIMFSFLHNFSAKNCA